MFFRSSRRTLRPSYRSCRRVTTRSFSSASVARKDKVKPPEVYNYNDVSFSETVDPDVSSYPLVTSNDLERGSEPPRRVRMLVRDFIEDSLYNSHYGYFPKQANIFTQRDTRIDFSSMRNEVEFQAEVGRRYAAYGVEQHEGPGRQIWHTPTELFKPYYGRAIAQCLVSEYLLKYFPYEDFIIYEIGAGNGTLAMDILDHIQHEYPDVYVRTKYNIIEISTSLADLQRKALATVHPCARVFKESIFHWTKREPAPCFFVAMEVVDNFAHDLIRYDLRTLAPLQGLVAIDEKGEFSMYYTAVTDPLIKSLLALRERLLHPPALSPLLKSPALRQLFVNLPFAPNLSAPEYIPTRLLNLLTTLRGQFPRHRLLLSDFSSLPDTLAGTNAPVVQTRVRGVTVPCSTLLVRQGFFDIFFPTDFERLRDMYEFMLAEPDQATIAERGARSSPLASSMSPLSLGSDFFSSSRPDGRRNPLDGVISASGLPVGERQSGVWSHSEFLGTYADLAKTRLRSGENVMLDFYKNVKFLF